MMVRIIGRGCRLQGLFYHHLALEDFHPGPKVRVLTPRGRVLGRASRNFLKKVRWQGSGIASSGLRLHYSGARGRLRFTSYSKRIWGHGTGYGYRVHPYRTIAVNFRGP